MAEAHSPEAEGQRGDTGGAGPGAAAVSVQRVRAGRRRRESRSHTVLRDAGGGASVPLRRRGAARPALRTLRADLGAIGNGRAGRHRYRRACDCSGAVLARPAASTPSNGSTFAPKTPRESLMPHRAPSYGSGRLASLDGLRACSIVLVLLGHLAGARHFLSFETINRVGDLGNLGVRVFFVISGFLITGLLAAERKKAGRVDLTAFYVRRALRIVPAFLVFLAGAVILSRAGFAWLDRRDFLQAVTYTFNYRGPTPNFSLRHLWSLAVEEQFYLIWPLTFASLAVANGRRTLGAVLVLVPILRVAIPMIAPGYIAYVPTAFESVCDALATGCLTALLLPELRRSAWVQRIIFSRLFPLAIALVWFANRQSDHPKVFWLICIPLMNVLIALLMIRYVERPSLPFGRFLNTRPMVAIG